MPKILPREQQISPQSWIKEEMWLQELQVDLSMAHDKSLALKRLLQAKRPQITWTLCRISSLTSNPNINPSTRQCHKPCSDYSSKSTSTETVSCPHVRSIVLSRRWFHKWGKTSHSGKETSSLSLTSWIMIGMVRLARQRWLISLWICSTPCEGNEGGEVEKKDGWFFVVITFLFVFCWWMLIYRLSNDLYDGSIWSYRSDLFI